MIDEPILPPNIKDASPTLTFDNDDEPVICDSNINRNDIMV